MAVTDQVSADIAYSSKDAVYRRSVYFCVDSNFFKYALFVADRIANMTEDRDFDLCIVSAETLPDHELVEKHNIRIIRIDTGSLEKALPTDERISFASYLRIFVPELMSDEYDRMLYLDADLFYQRGDLKRLLSIEMGTKAVAAVRDMCQLRKPDRHVKEFKDFDLPYSPYFNAGILLIDVRNWVDQRVGRTALEVCVNNPEKLSYHDQTALNVTLHNNWVELPLVWNFLYSHQTMYFSAMFDVCFYHFIGRRKPFTSTYGAFPRRITEAYQTFMNDYFPDESAKIQAGLQIDRHWLKHVFVFVFHLVNFRRFLRNDDRFRSEWDIRY